MHFTRVCAFAAALTVLAAPATAQARATDPTFTAGAPGAGDPYYPNSGNGGYDVRDYHLDLTYRPDTRVLSGSATLTARATQNLSRFNLDLHGLTVRSVTVCGKPATWTRDGDELIITPAAGLRQARDFTVLVRYDGVPQAIGTSWGGFTPTDDGAVVFGEPHGASTWFPVNDHPSDTATYTVRTTVPKDLTVVSNGVLDSHRTGGAWSTWTWRADKPMASYLATIAVGHFDLRAYQAGGLRYWDAVDTELFRQPFAPHSGTRFAIATVPQYGYQRLMRTLAVPADGGRLSFWINRETQKNQEFAMVEAHTVGRDDWTTLPDANGHTSNTVGWELVCDSYPFLAHYVTTDPTDGTCKPTGSTGTWSAATGVSQGWEQWAMDLTPYAGREVEVSITHLALPLPAAGVVVDDVTFTTGQGNTSFEEDGDVMDGWQARTAPEGSPVPNPREWITGTADQLPPTVGASAMATFSRQPAIISFLSELFGPYPFSSAGGIVDAQVGGGGALETQTRPVYGRAIFSESGDGDYVVAHELAHQWCGDSLPLASWRNIWLNEGFATYAHWLWQERTTGLTAQQQFDDSAATPDDDPFWQVKIGDPGPDHLLDWAVYARGAMTLHQLRRTIGDQAFFSLLRQWTATMAGKNVTIEQFVELAERVSGQELDSLFTTWLFTPGKPSGIGSSVSGSASPLPRSFTAGRGRI